MTLAAKEPNQHLQQAESAKRKRTLEDFLKSEGPKPKGSSGSDKENSPVKKKIKSPKNSNDDLDAKDPLSSPLSSPPAQSPGLTASGSSPLDRQSPTPNTPSRSAPVILSKVPTTKPVASEPAQVNNDPSKKAPEKKKRTVLSAEEKAARAAADEAKKAEREAAKQKKAEEIAKAEELKRQKQAEKDQKKKEREEELAKKRREKEEKEKKKREKEEEAAKKLRSQPTLFSMLKTSTPKKDQPAAVKVPNGDATTSTETPVKTEDKEQSLYKKMFKDFYLKEHVRLAPNPAEMDEKTREAQTKILEEYISGVRTHTPASSFDALEVLELPFKVKRGQTFPSVKKIMAEFSSDSQTSQQAKHLQELLNQVPVVSIKFFEDVRPPYVGTISNYPKGLAGLKKLAKRPVRKDILPLTYDYDSEAEWQEEDGEDIEDLDDEDDEDEDEDMADFLDDADDVGPSRMVFSGGMEPESSGLCWENRKRGTSEMKMYKWRMEFILDKLEHHHSIDPFSTAYWETPKPAKSETGNQKSSTAASATKSASAAAKSSLTLQEQSANPTSRTAPTDAFQALHAGAGKKRSQQPLPLELQEKLKALVRERPTLSKVGVIELFTNDHNNCTRAQVKNAFAELIVKSGREHKVKGE
ncbi:chromatin assembly factor 1 subunit A-domain-containing protein [Apiosordaria backusii]|uniref:Chromatin assembly factor 1 subunit A-domain-containing protein n=1 Tax=Apiosordaria backusii TaxID=314023 RepID=A0AA40BSI2_9PEZI|nr:chromatin assembly factor 1 subunit A-domain-containing protein [Apiosordaria backusii]